MSQTIDLPPEFQQLQSFSFDAEQRDRLVVLSQCWQALCREYPGLREAVCMEPAAEPGAPWPQIPAGAESAYRRLLAELVEFGIENKAIAKYVRPKTPAEIIADLERYGRSGTTTAASEPQQPQERIHEAICSARMALQMAKRLGPVRHEVPPNYAADVEELRTFWRTLIGRPPKVLTPKSLSQAEDALDMLEVELNKRFGPPAPVQTVTPTPDSAVERAEELLKLQRSHRLAYRALEYAAQQKGKSLIEIKDQEAHDLLKDEGMPKDKDDWGDLDGYKLPKYSTFTTYCNKARSKMGENKNNSRAGRRTSKSAVRENQVEQRENDD